MRIKPPKPVPHTASAPRLWTRLAACTTLLLIHLLGRSLPLLLARVTGQWFAARFTTVMVAPVFVCSFLGASRPPSLFPWSLAIASVSLPLIRRIATSPVTTSLLESFVVSITELSTTEVLARWTAVGAVACGPPLCALAWSAGATLTDSSKTKPAQSPNASKRRSSALFAAFVTTAAMHSATWFRYPVPLHLSRSHCVVPALSAMVTSTLGTVTASSFRYRRLKSVLVAVAAVSALASAELKACVRCDSGPASTAANTAGRFSTLWSCELEQGGYLSVVQVTKTFASHATSSRYVCLLMRLDHAIMGGTWLLPAHVAGRPVYSAFHLQTAARLFASPANTDQRRSLHVGLGAGAGVAALQRHGFATDVIELHPEIIDAAERFFGVNATHQSGSSIAGDAAQVLPTTVPAGKYDVVLLDTFSGEGDAAASVNSVRFFREISRVMVAKHRQRTGVLAVNIVGTQASDLTTVACRIAHVFQHLRCFAAETEDNDARRKRSAIRNFVIFASQSDYLKGVQINAATVKQQHARLTADDAAVEEEMLGDMASREIQLDTRRATCASLEGSNLDGGGAALTRALHHWKTMRDQFHGGFWES